MKSAGKALLAAILVLALALTLTMVSPAWAGVTCPPEDKESPGPTLEEMYYYTDLLVMGKVMEHRPAQARGPEVYTAEMEVYCVYKGEDVQHHIDIADVGKVPDKCFESAFEVGNIYFAYLKRHKDGRLTPAYKQHPESYKDEMIYICGVNITLPVGLSKLPEGVKCENTQEYDYDEDYYYTEDGKNTTCFSFKPPTEDPTYKTEKTEDDGNGNEPLRMSLLLLALLHVAVLVFS